MGMFQVCMTSSTNMSSEGLNAQPQRDVYPLSKVTKAVSQMLDDRAGGKRFWVRAEISHFQIKGKYAYLDLVEEQDGQRLAFLKGTIWAGQLQAIRKALGKEFDEVLKPGREIVFSAQMAFNAVWGFSLNIQEIDLDALLGEMERRRKATLESLQKEGCIGRNARESLAPVPQRLILIGSKGTAGFTDFLAHLEGNEFGYAHDVGIIDAQVQGVKAAKALVAALLQAGRAALKTPVDAVVLLRGGGAKLDLDAFNDLSLCRTIAAMEVPVIVGVGHETDQTLVDVVAHTACKTPTAVASFIVDRTARFESEVGIEAQRIAAESQAQLAENRSHLGQYAILIKERPLTMVRTERGSLHSGANGVVRRTLALLSEQRTLIGGVRAGLSAVASGISDAQKRQIEHIGSQLRTEVQRQLKQHEERVGSVKGTLALLGPGPTLKRGFSVTRKEGHAVSDARDLAEGDVIVTEFAQGSVSSVVKTITPPKD